MFLYALLLLLHVLHGTGEMDRPSNSTIIETRITTVVLPRSYISSDAYGLRGPRPKNLRQAAVTTSGTSGVSVSICWLNPVDQYPSPCVDLFRFVNACFNSLGGITNPNDQSQSKTFQDCLCLPKATVDASFRGCKNCFGSVDISASVLGIFTNTFQDFCSTPLPSLYLFVSNVIAFMQQARAPKPYGPLNGAFTQITTMSAAFTSVSGMNQVPTTTGGVLVNPLHPTLSMTVNFPQSLLAQIPLNWPYTTYGVARRPGQATSLYLTNEQKQTAALVVANLQWFPRPLGKQKPLFALPPPLNGAHTSTNATPSKSISPTTMSQSAPSSSAPSEVSSSMPAPSMTGDEMRSRTDGFGFTVTGLPPSSSTGASRTRRNGRGIPKYAGL